MSEMTSSPSPSPIAATRREHLPHRAEDYPGVGFGQVVLREAGQVTTIHDEKPRGGRMPRNARRAQLLEPLRDTPFERLFFREPVNGYLFEVIDRERHRQLLEKA